MAFSDLCHISNAFKTIENEPDQSERIMEENSMVRDLITKILDETGPTDSSSSLQTPEKTLNGLSSSNLQYHKNDSGHTSYIPPTNFNSYQDPSLYSFTQNEQNNFGFNLSNGFGNTNGFVNYSDNDSSLLNMDMTDASTDIVTPEQLNLLRLAAQEIGGAQFASPNNDKFYNYFEPNQRNSLPENNMFPTNNFNRPNSLNLDLNFNSNFDNNPFNNVQRFPSKFDNAFVKEQDSTDILSYLNQLNLSAERSRDESALQNNLDFKLPPEINGHYQKDEFNKIQDDRNNAFYNRNFQQMPPKNYQNGENSFFLNEIIKQMDRSPANQNFDFAQTTPVSAPNSMNYKPNGFHAQNDFMQRRDINQPIPRENFPINGINDQRANFELNRDGNMQQAAMIRQNQELARQMSLLMRSRPPPNQLNVDVSYLHESSPFNLGLGALLAPNTQVPPPVLPSPMLDLPLLAPFYAMRNMRGAATSSGILHARLDACYEQWRQLERERKRTEARLALAYPGRAVSSSNSIPVPRLPPCPTRVDRLTVDMLREHTKVLTLMGKMETLRASVCIAQNKKPTKGEDCKITVLKRGQENVVSEKEKENGVDPSTFDPITWRDDVKNLSEIAPHSEVENAMLAWRNAVSAVQAARRRELAPHTPANNPRYMRTDPILQLAEAVKQLGICARRARCAMWCDLTLTVALAPPNTPPPSASATPISTVNAAASSITKTTMSDKPQSSVQLNSPKIQENPNNNSNQAGSKPNINETKDEKPPTESTSTSTKTDTKSESNNNKVANKQTDKQDKNQPRRTQNYRHKINQGRNDFYQKNQRYENRFMYNRNPYHYLATGPIN